MSESWQKDYMNNKAAEVANRRILNDVINRTTTKFYNAGYQKYKIDKAIDKKATFDRPYVHDLYEIVQESPDFARIKRSFFDNLYTIDDYTESIHESHIQQAVNKLYEEYEKREQMKSNLISIFLICCGSALFTWLMVY